MTKPSLPFSQVLSDPSQRLSGMFSVRRSAPRDGLATSLPLRKEIVGQAGNWTITDANLSPDNSRYVAVLRKQTDVDVLPQDYLFFDRKSNLTRPNTPPYRPSP